MKIALIGTGKVAAHLTERLKRLSLDLSGVLGSSTTKTASFSSFHNIHSLNNYADLAQFDLCFVCVQDSHIRSVLNESLKYCNCVTLSGTFDIHELEKSTFKLGVFYPLQTFSKDALIDFEKIPFFIESEDTEFEQELMNLAEIIGKEGISMNAEQRKHLHLTAVFLNNFTHHICALGNEYAKENNIEFHWFEALLDETFRKIVGGASFKDQTGPAQRGDQNTMEKHIQLLDEMKANVYKTLSDSIQRKKLIND